MISAFKIGKPKIVISNTNKKRSQQNIMKRRNECEQGLSILQKALPDIKFLKEVSVQTF